MTSLKPVSEKEKEGREGGRGGREREEEETLSEFHDSGLSIPSGIFDAYC